MNNIDDILNSPDYFYCEKFRAKIKKTICIERQMGSNAIIEQYKTSEIGLSFEVCKICNQGKTIRDELYKEKVKPCRGDGNRYETCPFYNDCLDRVAKKDWKTFNCESCNLLKMPSETDKKNTEDVKNTRVCKTPDCSNITPHPNFPYCHSCMGERKKNKPQGKDEGKKEQKERIKGPQNAGTDKGIQPISIKENASHKGNTALTIDFGRHAEILDTIRGIAEEELRPVDMQIIYMLKKQLQEVRAQA